MSDLTRFIDDGRAKTSVCTALMLAADAINRDESKAKTIAKVLADDAPTDRIHSGDLTAEQADWVTHEARYRIACTLGVPVENRHDPIIDAVIAALAIQPQDRQVRILVVTAHQCSITPFTRQEAEYEPCMICGETTTAFLCPECETATAADAGQDEPDQEAITLPDVRELAEIVATVRGRIPDSAEARLMLNLLGFLQKRHPDLTAKTWIKMIRDAETAS